MLIVCFEITDIPKKDWEQIICQYKPMGRTTKQFVATFMGRLCNPIHQ